MFQQCVSMWALLQLRLIMLHTLTNWSLQFTTILSLPFEWSVMASTTTQQYTRSPNCDINEARLSSSVWNDKFLSTQNVNTTTRAVTQWHATYTTWQQSHSSTDGLTADVQTTHSNQQKAACDMTEINHVLNWSVVACMCTYSTDSLVFICPIATA